MHDDEGSLHLRFTTGNSGHDILLLPVSPYSVNISLMNNH